MKKQLLIIVMVLTTALGFSQTVQIQGSPNRATHYLGGLQADSTLVVPVRNHDSIYPNLPYKGRVQVNSDTGVLEYHNGEEWVETGANGASGPDASEKIQKEIDGFTAQVKFPSTATGNSYWVFPQTDSNSESPRYVPIDVNGAVADNNGSVAVSLQSVINNTIGKLVGYDKLNFYIPDYALGSFPNILTYNSSADEQNFTIVGGVRNDGRAYGPEALAENDYVTKSQLDEMSGPGISPISIIDEGNGSGYITTNRNPDNYGALGLGATDLSYSSTSGSTGATGDYSFATGFSTTAAGNNSFASGISAEASGAASTALGQNTVANSFSSMSIGYNNLPIIENTETAQVQGSPLFVAGNGADTVNRSNAYALFNDGNSTQYGVASYGGDYSSSYTDRSLVDKEYVDSVILQGEKTNFLERVNDGIVQKLKFADSFQYSCTFELPDREGTWTLPTSFNGGLADSQTGEVYLTISDVLHYSQTTAESPAVTNNLYISSQSSGTQDILTFEQYLIDNYQIVSGIKFDGRAYGPLAIDSEDYAPLSQIESLIGAANSTIQLSGDNPAMIFDLGGGSKTSIEALTPNTNVTAILQFPSPAADGSYRLATNINGYNADNTGQITIDANGIFNSGSTAVVQDLIDLRSDDGLIFTHTTSGNKLEVNGDGIEYNNNLLVDKPTLINYVASATNIGFTATKSAAELNSAYPGVNEGFIVKCPNAGGIYLKTAVGGQWQFIAATTLNP